MTSGSEAAKTVVTTTLDAMAAGGIYDHVGGGFARYSTDREWLVPHFEKMLSDQALLVQTYLHALAVLREPQWRFVVQDTIEYVLNTLTHEEGRILLRGGRRLPQCRWHGASRGCSLPGHPMKCGRRSRTRDPTSSTLYLSIGTSPTMATSRPKTDLASIPNRVHHRDDLIRSDEITYARSRMAEARLERPRPGLDDKVILEWNALFLAALSQAGATFNHQPWLDAAVRNAGFLIDNMRGRNGRLVPHMAGRWQSPSAPRRPRRRSRLR